MSDFLEFRDAKCRDCYKCLRECPVKAIDVKNHQAKIIEDRCILCGHCTLACPQNAKVVHSELDDVKRLLDSGQRVVASVAPSFISSFGVKDFTIFKIALAKLGFADAEETAIGAQAVVKEYKRLLATGEFENFITSACPAACRMIQEYYPKALKYLAPVDSPMVAHAKLIRKCDPEVKIVFIGPCIAKKREAVECELVENVLTFEDLQLFFEERNIKLEEISELRFDQKGGAANLAKSFPINHGIINSFDVLPKGYEYIPVDGPKRCSEALENIEFLSHVFLEINICENACVAGPCALQVKGGSVKAMSDIRKYVRREREMLPSAEDTPLEVNLFASYPRIRSHSIAAPERDIEAILHRTGKMNRADELNCGACGYSTCRDKAWAVYNGYADVEICLPYMRQRAESLSYEIIQKSQEGVIVLDADMNIVEVNNKAKELLAIDAADVKGRPAIDYFKPIDFMNAYSQKRHVLVKDMFIPTTMKHVDISINYLEGQDVLFGVLKDVTDVIQFDKEIMKVKMETLATTDEVIKKQMRVAQEIASLLGETTAETKVALLKLKKTLTSEQNGQ